MDLKELAGNLHNNNDTEPGLWKEYVKEYKDTVVLLSDKSLIEKKDS